MPVNIRNLNSISAIDGAMLSPEVKRLLKKLRMLEYGLGCTPDDIQLEVDKVSPTPRISEVSIGLSTQESYITKDVIGGNYIMAAVHNAPNNRPRCKLFAAKELIPVTLVSEDSFDIIKLARRIIKLEPAPPNPTYLELDPFGEIRAKWVAVTDNYYQEYVTIYRSHRGSRSN